MFRAMLRVEWQWTRLVVVLGAVAGFALPVLSLRSAAGSGAAGPARLQEMLGGLQSWGMLYPLLAGLLGLLVAIGCWAPDHRGRHVHALTLPLPRWRYALLRYAAGLCLLVAPMLAVTSGAVLAAALVTIPPGLQAYPFALGFRFALAALVAFSLFFAISGGTGRTAGVVLGLLGLVLVVQVLASAAEMELDVMNTTLRVLLTWPGPLAIFGGRWMLIDV